MTLKNTHFNPFNEVEMLDWASPTFAQIYLLQFSFSLEPVYPIVRIFKEIYECRRSLENAKWICELKKINQTISN